MFIRGSIVSAEDIKERFLPMYQKINSIVSFNSTTTGQYVVDSSITSLLPNVAAEEIYVNTEIAEHTSDNFGIEECEGYSCDFLEYFKDRWEQVNG